MEYEPHLCDYCLYFGIQGTVSIEPNHPLSTLVTFQDVHLRTTEFVYGPIKLCFANLDCPSKELVKNLDLSFSLIP